MNNFDEGLFYTMLFNKNLFPRILKLLNLLFFKIALKRIPNLIWYFTTGVRGSREFWSPRKRDQNKDQPLEL